MTIPSRRVEVEEADEAEEIEEEGTEETLETGLKRGFGSARNWLATGRGFCIHEEEGESDRLVQGSLLVPKSLSAASSFDDWTDRSDGSMSRMKREGVSYSMRP